MNKSEIYQMFFNCLAKMKFNIYNCGVNFVDEVLELSSLIDEGTALLYRIAASEGIVLKYDMTSIESQADYPYVEGCRLNIDNFKDEMNKVVDHLLSHIKEVSSIFREDGKFYVSNLLEDYGTKLYRFKIGGLYE
ncbi:MAG: hypothetical protein SOZ40_05235 [Ezakiella sp.]|nr:hypothetical protein [Ezakiella sp.]MDD7761132.1 hypothetical protein [Bacillota bacterium]MDY3947367.1 hypothetical protein [Ezakiella sp.]